jgi:hypothetical protein
VKYYIKEMANIHTRNNPHLFDKAFNEIQESLGSNVLWLDNIFGKAERLVKVVNGKKIYSPNVYIGGNEYKLITPDTRTFGNYSFFLLHEPISTHYDVGEPTSYKTQFSLIVWCDLRKVETEDERNTEAIKRELLYVLNERTRIRYGWFKINKIYERAENVFKDFTLDEVDNQFLMQPYCGWRFEGEIYITDECHGNI